MDVVDDENQHPADHEQEATALALRVLDAHQVPAPTKREAGSPREGNATDQVEHTPKRARAEGKGGYQVSPVAPTGGGSGP